MDEQDCMGRLLYNVTVLLLDPAFVSGGVQSKKAMSIA
jgi:hypothetical protein